MSKPARTVRRRAVAAWPIMLGLLAAALFWALAWRAMDRSVLTLVPVLDEAHYLRSAHALVSSGWRAEGPFYMSPLYTVLVAVTGSGRAIEDRLRDGPPPVGLRVLQAFCWLGTAWLLRRTGAALLGPRWGWLPPLLWLGYLPAAVLAAQVLMEVPQTFLATLALAAAGGWAGPRAPLARATLAGAAIGLACSLRGTSVVLLAPALWLLWSGGAPRDRRAAGVLVTAAALAIAPFAAWNSALAGRLVGPSLNAGINLYLGNADRASGFFRSPPGLDMERDLGGVVYLADRFDRPGLDLAAADAAWTSLALQAVREQPARAAGLWLRKVRLHLAALEIPQISPPNAWQDDVPVFRLLVVPWGLVSAGAVAGALLAWRRRPQLRPWLIAALLVIAVQSLFFVVDRYRLILLPAFALSAGAALQALALARGRTLVRAACAAAVAAAVVWPWGLGFAREQLEVGGDQNLAVRWTHLGNARRAAGDDIGAQAAWREASQRYDRALARFPAVVSSRLEAARLRVVLGDTLGAVALVEGHPRGLAADIELPRLGANLLLAAGRPRDAVRHLEAALAHDPHDPVLLFNLTLALLRLGEPAAALPYTDRLRRAEPQRPRADLLAAQAHLARGDPEAARAVLREGLRRLPGQPELLGLLERLDHADR